MIEIKVKSTGVDRDLVSFKCPYCYHNRVYKIEELEKDGYNKCVSCGNLLPDIESLAYRIDHRLTYHTRHSEHFVR